MTCYLYTLKLKARANYLLASPYFILNSPYLEIVLVSPSDKLIRMNRGVTYVTYIVT